MLLLWFSPVKAYFRIRIHLFKSIEWWNLKSNNESHYHHVFLLQVLALTIYPTDTLINFLSSVKSFNFAANNLLKFGGAEYCSCI